MKAIRLITRCLACCLLPAVALLVVLYAPVGVILGAATLTSSTISVSVGWQYDLAVTGTTSSTTNRNTLTASLATTNGTGAAGTADLIYFVQAAIAASGNTTIDVSGGSTDFFGTTITMARVKIFYINVLTSTTGSSVQIGNATNPIVNWISGTTPSIKVNNGGIWLQGDTGATGYAVTAATGDVLKVLNNDGANTATCNIVIIGSSA